MYGPIFVTGQKSVKAQRDATPEYPSFQIGLVGVVDRVVGKTKLITAEGKLHGVGEALEFIKINSAAGCQTLRLLSRELNNLADLGKQFLQIARKLGQIDIKNQTENKEAMA